jgi:hypothetical protein
LFLELSLVATVGSAVDFFEDQLANAHFGLKLNRQGAHVPDFQLQRNAVGIGFPKTRMDCRGGDMNPETQPGEAAFAFDARRQARLVGDANAF